MPLPNPSDFDDRDSFMSACVPAVIDEGKTPDEAVAVCSTLWDDSGKSAESTHEEAAPAVNPDPPAPRRAGMRVSDRDAPKAGAVNTRSAEMRVTDEEHREVLFVASDETEDRYGDVIKADGWQLTAYQQNPILLFSHDYTAPIGNADVYLEGNRLMALARWPQKGLDFFADKIWRLVAARVLRAVSVGFRALEDPIPRKNEDGDWSGGYTWPVNELMEISVVSVPANPAALAVQKSAARKIGIDEETIARVFPEDPARVRALKDFVHTRLALTKLGVTSTR